MTKGGLGSIVTLAGVLAVAGCGSSSSGGGNGGSPGAGGPGGMTEPDAGAASCNDMTKLYDRLGCEPGLTKAADAIAAAELANADIASYFAYIGAKDTSGYTHPTPTQIESCLVSFLSNATGGPDPYPTTTPDGFVCRPMTTGHKDLYISGGSFDTFLMIAASTLSAAPFNVSSSDLGMVGGALGALKPMIVNPLLADAGLETLTDGIKEADASDQ